MKIGKITIDSSHFYESRVTKTIHEYIEEKNIKRTDIINITETSRFTTLWYFQKN